MKPRPRAPSSGLSSGDCDGGGAVRASIASAASAAQEPKDQVRRCSALTPPRRPPAAAAFANKIKLPTRARAELCAEIHWHARSVPAPEPFSPSMGTLKDARKSSKHRDKAARAAEMRFDSIKKRRRPAPRWRRGAGRRKDSRRRGGGDHAAFRALLKVLNILLNADDEVSRDTLANFLGLRTLRGPKRPIRACYPSAWISCTTV